jgi:hypothetical protein
MNNLISILPFLLLIILFVFILARRGESPWAKASFKSQDWLTLTGITFAGVVLTSALKSPGLQDIIQKAPKWLLATVPSLLLLVVIGIIMLRVKPGQPIANRMGDERVNGIYAKSSRNALFGTWVAFFVHLLITYANTLDTTWVVITIAGGIAVLLTSFFFYYYRTA